MRRITVLGDGFAALHAVRELERAFEGRPRLELSLLAPTETFTYTPLLPHVASGRLEADALQFSLPKALAPSTRFEQCEVDRIDSSERRIVGPRGGEPFDYLIVAPAPLPDWQSNESCRRHAAAAWTPEGASDLAATLSGRIDDADDQSPPPLGVVGGGTGGIEIASEMHRRLDAGGKSDPDGSSVVVFEAEETLLPNGPEKLRHACRTHLRSADIEVQTDRRVVECGDSKLTFDDGSCRRIDAVAWCGGIRPPEWVRDSSLGETGEAHVSVEPTLAAADASGIYVAGVAAAPPDVPAYRPHLASHQGVWAAKNLRADLSGRTLRPWMPEDESWLVALGTGGAVVLQGDSSTTGRAASILYRLRHASWLPDPLTNLKLARDWLGSDAD